MAFRLFLFTYIFVNFSKACAYQGDLHTSMMKTKREQAHKWTEMTEKESKAIKFQGEMPSGREHFYTVRCRVVGDLHITISCSSRQNIWYYLRAGLWHKLLGDIWIKNPVIRGWWALFDRFDWLVCEMFRLLLVAACCAGDVARWLVPLVWSPLHAG